jgi:hypothetical protein
MVYCLNGNIFGQKRSGSGQSALISMRYDLADFRYRLLRFFPIVFIMDPNGCDFIFYFRYDQGITFFRLIRFYCLPNGISYSFEVLRSMNLEKRYFTMHIDDHLPYFISTPRLVLPSRTGRVTGCDLRNHIIAPLCRCRPRLSRIAGTPPQSSGGREEVSFTPMKIIAYLLRLAGSCAAWIAPALAIVAPPHVRSFHGSTYL